MPTTTEVSADDILVLAFIRQPGFFRLECGTSGGTWGQEVAPSWQVGAVPPTSMTGGVCWGGGLTIEAAITDWNSRWGAASATPETT